MALIDALNKAKPAGSKGIYLKKISVSSTMGAGVRVDTTGFAAVAASERVTALAAGSRTLSVGAAGDRVDDAGSALRERRQSEATAGVKDCGMLAARCRRPSKTAGSRSAQAGV